MSNEVRKRERERGSRRLCRLCSFVQGVGTRSSMALHRRGQYAVNMITTCHEIYACLLPILIHIFILSSFIKPPPADNNPPSAWFPETHEQIAGSEMRGQIADSPVRVGRNSPTGIVEIAQATSEPTVLDPIANLQRQIDALNQKDLLRQGQVRGLQGQIRGLNQKDLLQQGQIDAQQRALNQQRKELNRINMIFDKRELATKFEAWVLAQGNNLKPDEDKKDTLKAFLRAFNTVHTSTSQFTLNDSDKKDWFLDGINHLKNGGNVFARKGRPGDFDAVFKEMLEVFGERADYNVTDGFVAAFKRFLADSKDELKRSVEKKPHL